MNAKVVNTAHDSKHPSCNTVESTKNHVAIQARIVHVASDRALATAVAAVREATAGERLVVTAEAPVAWPSGAFVHACTPTSELPFHVSTSWPRSTKRPKV